MFTHPANNMFVLPLYLAFFYPSLIAAGRGGKTSSLGAGFLPGLSDVQPQFHGAKIRVCLSAWEHQARFVVISTLPYFVLSLILTRSWAGAGDSFSHQEQLSLHGAFPRHGGSETFHLLLVQGDLLTSHSSEVSSQKQPRNEAVKCFEAL